MILSELPSYVVTIGSLGALVAAIVTYRLGKAKNAIDKSDSAFVGMTKLADSTAGRLTWAEGRIDRLQADVDRLEAREQQLMAVMTEHHVPIPPRPTAP